MMYSSRGVRVHYGAGEMAEPLKAKLTTRSIRFHHGREVWLQMTGMGAGTGSWLITSSNVSTSQRQRKLEVM